MAFFCKFFYAHYKATPEWANIVTFHSKHPHVRVFDCKLQWYRNQGFHVKTFPATPRFLVGRNGISLRGPKELFDILNSK